MQRCKNSLYLPRRALKLLIKSLFMEKTPFYRTKAFWTLIASIIAALAAYFTVSCSYSQKIFRHGIHHDTVRIESKIKTRDLSCLTTNLGTPSHSLSSSNLELISWKHSLLLAPTMPSTVTTSLFGLPWQTVFNQTAVDSIVAAQVPFYFTIEQGLFDSECNRVIYEFNISDLFFFIYARFSGSCSASRSLSSWRSKKRKTPSKGQKHNNRRTTPVVVDLDF